MQPLALILNIAIIVGIVGIMVYWVRRFAVFLGYKAIQPDVLQIAELLKAQPIRERSDVVISGLLWRASYDRPLLPPGRHAGSRHSDAGAGDGEFVSGAKNHRG